MLTKRAQILFEEKDWGKISSLAKKKETSVSALIREAVQKLYIQQDNDEEIAKRRRKAYEEILRIRPKPVKGRINYKEMINYGRKY